MTIQPFLTCVLGLAVATAFEVAYHKVAKYWSTPNSKGIWAGLLWLVVILILVPAGIMPYEPPEVIKWAPFIAIGVFHIIMAEEGRGFYFLGRTESNTPPDSPSSQSTHNGSGSKHVQQLRSSTRDKGDD